MFAPSLWFSNKIRTQRVVNAWLAVKRLINSFQNNGNEQLPAMKVQRKTMMCTNYMGAEMTISVTTVRQVPRYGEV